MIYIMFTMIIFTLAILSFFEYNYSKKKVKVRTKKYLAEKRNGK